MEMIGCVGNGDAVMVTGFNVDVGTDVGETAVGTGVSVGKVTVCCPQATRNARRTIHKYRCGVKFVIIANLIY
jgi:hypothetical protein